MNAVVRWAPKMRLELAGRGTVMCGPYPFDCPPAEACGRRLDVAGDLFVVRGVEWKSPDWKPPVRGQDVALVVRAAAD